MQSSHREALCRTAFLHLCSGSCDNIFVSSVSKDFHYNFIYEQNYLALIANLNHSKHSNPLIYFVKVRSDNTTEEKRITGAQPEIFQGRGGFVKLAHFDKHFVKNSIKKGPEGKVSEFFLLATLKTTL